MRELNNLFGYDLGFQLLAFDEKVEEERDTGKHNKGRRNKDGIFSVN